MVKNQVNKGLVTEETLRCYFNTIGYFSVRGVPLVYKNYEVTDVDLWLYIKASSLSSERVCVDVKRKRTPQAMERILWVKGLKSIIGVEKAMVATSDNRPETRAFGSLHKIGVLQGDFLKRVNDAYKPKERLTEEELLLKLNTPCIVEPQIKWHLFYINAKAQLIDSLNFNGCNRLLVANETLFKEYAASNGSEVAIRLLYIITAYVLIMVDFISPNHVPLEASVRKELLTEGFRYGEAGHQKTEESIQMTIDLLNVSGGMDLCSKDLLEEEFNKQVSEYRADVLGEFFSRSETIKNIYNTAKHFESLGYSKKLEHPKDIPSQQKSVIGILCDFYGIDRKEII